MALSDETTSPRAVEGTERSDEQASAASARAAAVLRYIGGGIL
jgi:hypothetical protein